MEWFTFSLCVRSAEQDLGCSIFKYLAFRSRTELEGKRARQKAEMLKVGSGFHKQVGSGSKSGLNIKIQNPSEKVGFRSQSGSFFDGRIRFFGYILKPPFRLWKCLKTDLPLKISTLSLPYPQCSPFIRHFFPLIPPLFPVYSPHFPL